MPGCGQTGERLPDTLVAHMGRRTEGSARQSVATGLLQRVEKEAVQIGRGRRHSWFLGANEAQVQVLLGAQQGERERVGSRRGAMLDR